MLAPAQSDKVARGKYLTENVAICADCHTEHLANGMPNVAKQLRGGLLPFKPIAKMPWAPLAPDLTPRGAIWQTFGEAGLVRFLQTGLNPSGNRPNPPMPPYRLSREDAEAIVAYLKTLR